MLFLADIDRQIVALVRDSDDLPRVNGRRGIDEHRAAVLRVEQTVSRRLARLERDERTVRPSRDLALERLITVEHRTHDAFASGIGQKFVSVTEQPARRNKKFKSGPASDRVHVQKFAFALSHFAHDRSDRRFGNVRDKSFKRFAAHPVDRSEKHLRGRYLKFVALAAHGLHKYGYVHFASAADAERLGRVGVLDAQGNVFQKFLVKSFAQVPRRDEFALFARKRTVVDHKRHFDRRLGDLDERKRLDRVGSAQRVSYRDVGNSGNGDDVADRRRLNGNSVQAVKLIQIDRFFLFRGHFGVEVCPHQILTRFYGAAFDPSDRDTSDVFVIIDRGNEHLKRSVLVALRRVDVIDDLVEQGFQILRVPVG